jgi:hypothetical protein
MGISIAMIKRARTYDDLTLLESILEMCIVGQSNEYILRGLFTLYHMVERRLEKLI